MARTRIAWCRVTMRKTDFEGRADVWSDILAKAEVPADAERITMAQTYVWAEDDGVSPEMMAKAQAFANSVSRNAGYILHHPETGERIAHDFYVDVSFAGHGRDVLVKVDYFRCPGCVHTSAWDGMDAYRRIRRNLRAELEAARRQKAEGGAA